MSIFFKKKLNWPKLVTFAHFWKIEFLAQKWPDFLKKNGFLAQKWLGQIIIVKIFMFSSRIAVQSYDEVTNRRICLLRIVVWPGDGVRDHGLVVVNFFLHGGLWDGRQLSSVDDFPDGRGEDAACVLGRRLRLRRFVGLVGRQLFFWRGFPHTTKRERSQFVISFQRRRLDHYEVRSEIKE